MKKFAMMLFALLIICAATSANARKTSAARSDWPANLPLPAFQLPHEKQVPPGSADDVTPPPSEPVRAIAEFDQRHLLRAAE